jgi:hypothetical protein
VRDIGLGAVGLAWYPSSQMQNLLSVMIFSAALSAAMPSAAAKRGPKSSAAGKRCRDVFCTSVVIEAGDRKPDPSRLTAQQVDRVMRPTVNKLEPCLVHERRRNPFLKGATIEFVITDQGRVLASRVNGERKSTLARCVHQQLRGLLFPRSGTKRSVASFRVALAR